MMLEGFREVDFALNLIDRTADGIWLQASHVNRLHDDEWELIGHAQAWSPEQVSAAADWFGRVAAKQEEPGGPHIWFGGGVCFGVVEEVPDGLAIDVLVMHDPDGQRPTFTGRFLDEGSAPFDYGYITVDVSAAVLHNVAAWWSQQAS